MSTSSPSCHSFTNPYHSRFQPYCSIRISPVRIPVVTCGQLHPHSILHHLSPWITLPTEIPSQGPTGTSFKILLPHGPVLGLHHWGSPHLPTIPVDLFSSHPEFASSPSLRMHGPVNTRCSSARTFPAVSHWTEFYPLKTFSPLF